MKKTEPKGNILMVSKIHGNGFTDKICDSSILPPERQKQNLARIAELYANSLLRRAAQKEMLAAV